MNNNELGFYNEVPSGRNLRNLALFYTCQKHTKTPINTMNNDVFALHGILLNFKNVDTNVDTP